MPQKNYLPDAHTSSIHIWLILDQETENELFHLAVDTLSQSFACG
jgi:hypothetical protein